MPSSEELLSRDDVLGRLCLTEELLDEALSDARISAIKTVLDGGQGCREDDLKRIGTVRLELDIRKLFNAPEEWLDEPNPNFDSRTPRSLLGTADEHILHQNVMSMIHGGA